MANLKGKGAMTNRSLIVSVPANGEVKNKEGKTVAYYLDVELDQSLKNHAKTVEGKTKDAQTNPHLVSESKKSPKTGRYFTNHRSRYSAEQFDAIKKAAGKKVHEFDPNSPQSKQAREIIGVTASLVPNAKGQVHIDTAKPMGPTKNPFFGKNTLSDQHNVTLAAQAKAETDYEAKKAASKEADLGKGTEALAKDDKSKEASGPEF